jgi:hypothetical protein
MAPGKVAKVLIARTAVVARVAAQFPAGIKAAKTVAAGDLLSHRRRVLSFHFRKLVQTKAEDVVEDQMEKGALTEEATGRPEAYHVQPEDNQ